MFAYAENVTRHPFSNWVLDRNGNPSEKPVFGPDLPLAAGFASTGTTESASASTDSVVLETADLYLPYGTATRSHDEWTVRGHRWQQTGEGVDWRSPITGAEFGTVVHIKRRSG